MTGEQREGGEEVFSVSPAAHLHHGGSADFLPRGNQQHGVGGPGEVRAAEADRDRGVRLGVVSGSAVFWTRSVEVCWRWVGGWVGWRGGTNGAQSEPGCSSVS